MAGCTRSTPRTPIASVHEWMKTQNAHLILQAEEARPSAKDERVVGGDHCDHVDALRLELVVLLEEGREVVRVARRLDRQTPWA